VSYSAPEVVWHQQHDDCQAQGLKILVSKDVIEGYQDSDRLKEAG